MNNVSYHCFFEQSGTFKNEFKKLNCNAYDYDILNDFNETDYQVDLFKDIELAYENKTGGVFDNIKENDYILAFFPCTRFECQITMWFLGHAKQQKKWTLNKKLEYDLKLIKELEELYSLICKLTLVCLKRNIKLIIENPYQEEHFLKRYWCIKPALLDLDRRQNGDFYKKPTQYFFINCEPKNNLLFDEPIANYKTRKISYENKVNRSMISKEYARKFIRENIL